MTAWKQHAKNTLARAGIKVQRLSEEERILRAGYDPRVGLTQPSLDALRPDNPRLLELERRYAALDSPLCAHTQWSSELTTSLADLRYFRGDNAYLWQYSRSPELNRLRYFIYAQHTYAEASRASLRSDLLEDGEFGCFTFSYEGMPLVSRDLLDSINELSFLDREWQLFDRADLRVVDIGAGYGRLAHRMAAVVPHLSEYLCLDAVPRSTFLSEFYLGHRQVAPASVVPLDELDSRLAGARPGLAVNVHSFSEMGYEAVEAWVRWMHDVEVPALFLVPNDGERLLSREMDGTRRDCAPLLQLAGFRLAASAPMIRDRAARELFGADDWCLLYERGAKLRAG